MIIQHHDDRLSWHGHISLERTDQYTRPWRIPFEQKNLFFKALTERAAMPAGVRLSFHGTTRRLAGKTMPEAGDVARKLDLYVDGTLFETVDIKGKTDFAFENLPPGEKLMELWLPQRADFALKELDMDDGAAIRPYTDTRKRWMTYGSSISHCGEAASPSFTWPGVVARGANVNLTCLGYGGQCHLDAMVARFMRDRPADYISMKLGINVCGNGSLNARSFGSSIIGFVQILREKHQKTPIALISPIYSFDRETVPNAVGWTLQDYRNAVEEAARTLRDNGDKHIIYINGLDLYNADLGHLMPDKLHPNAEGYKRLGENFLKHAAPKLFGA
jgi:lysophospholipase L1-like esterase